MSEETTKVGNFVIHGDRKTRLAVELGAAFSDAQTEMGIDPDSNPPSAESMILASAMAVILAKYLPPEGEKG